MTDAVPAQQELQAALDDDVFTSLITDASASGRGPLNGLAVSVKDNVNVAGSPPPRVPGRCRTTRRPLRMRRLWRAFNRPAPRSSQRRT